MSLRTVEAPISTKKTFTLTGCSDASELTWDSLTETEKSAASLGVDPASWRPISMLNSAHHETLLKANMIDSDLAKRLEAFKTVSAVGS